MDNHSGNIDLIGLYDQFNADITELIRRRYSCRVCLKTPVEGEILRKLETFAGIFTAGPFGSPLRFKVISASEQDSGELRGLGTYGFIRNPAGFIIGTAGAGIRNLEDFGYALESIVLYATELGLGTCWLGGSFTRSSFSERAGLQPGEILPAVVSFGYPAENSRDHPIRTLARSDRRLPWEKLFFEQSPEQPLKEEQSGIFRLPLGMVRLAPSASNRQPWRIIRVNDDFRFFLLRSRSTKPESTLNRWLGMADLQRVDMGIAMCHFDLTLKSQGIKGHWEIQGDPPSGTPVWEYTATWMPILHAARYGHC